MASLMNNSLFLGSVFVLVLGLLLLSHPFLTLTALSLCAVCHTVFHNVPTVARFQSFILSKVWGDNNDHSVVYTASLFDGADMPSPIPHPATGQETVRNRKNIPDEIISSTPQSSPNSLPMDNRMVSRNNILSSSEGRQLNFSRIAPKPTCLLTHEEYKSGPDCGSPKMRGRVSGVKTVQTVSGPLLASTRLNNSFDAGMYVNVNSPGFTERLVRCANDNASYNWNPGTLDTHQDKYNTVGLFPIVHLSTAPAPSLSTRNSLKAPRSSVRVRIAPPVYTEQRQYSGMGGNSLLGTMPSVREPVRQDEVAKSVLESLQEASRKRIYSQCQEAVEDDPSKKRQRKGDSNFPNPNSDLYQYRHIFRPPALSSNIGSSQSIDTLTQGKRGRDEGSPGSGDSKRHRQSNKSCTSRNEISSSLSSSQKLLQRLSGSKRKADSDLSRPGTPHGKHFKDDKIQDHCIPERTPPWVNTSHEDTARLKEKPRPYIVEGDSRVNQLLRRESHVEKVGSRGYEATGKNAGKVMPPQTEPIVEILKRNKASSPCDISSKLFRKEISSRPVHTCDESSKRGRSWAQEPPDADERCLSEQSGSSELDRPERFQSLLSRMCKQSGADSAKQGEKNTYPSLLASVQSPAVILTNPSVMVSQHLSPDTGTKSSLTFHSVPPSPVSVSLSHHVVDGGMEKQTFPRASISSGGSNGSFQTAATPCTSEDPSDMHSSEASVPSSSDKVLKSDGHVGNPPSSISSASNTDQLPSKPSLDFISSSSTSNTAQTHVTVSSKILQVESNAERAVAEKPSDCSSVKPVFSFKSSAVPASSELSSANQSSSLKSGTVTPSNSPGISQPSGNIPNLVSATFVSPPASTSAISGLGNQTFSLSSSSFDKTGPMPSFSSTSVSSQHDPKDPCISFPANGISTSSTLSPGGLCLMNTENFTLKPESSAGILNNIGASSLPSIGSSIGGSSSMYGVTTPMSSSTTTFTFSSPSSKTITSESQRPTFQSSPFVTGGTMSSSFSSSSSQGAFNSFGSTSTHNPSSTSAPTFPSVAPPQQSSSGLFNFGSSSNQAQSNFSTSPQAPNPLFGPSQAQGFGGSSNSVFSARSDGSAFGNPTPSSGTHPPVSSVPFGTPQPSVTNAFTAQSAPSSGSFGASSPFSSASVPSRQNFNPSSPSSFAVPSPVGFGSNNSSSAGSPFQFGASSDKPSIGTFNFGAGGSTFNFGNSSSQPQSVNQPFQFGQNASSSAPPTFQFGASGSQPPGGGTPVFSIGTGPSSSHRSRPIREARRRR